LTRSATAPRMTAHRIAEHGWEAGTLGRIAAANESKGDA
jgi:hypothetical protein